jgi:hypothetical protein
MRRGCISPPAGASNFSAGRPVEVEGDDVVLLREVEPLAADDDRTAALDDGAEGPVAVEDLVVPVEPDGRAALAPLVERDQVGDDVVAGGDGDDGR